MLGPVRSIRGSLIFAKLSFKERISCVSIDGPPFHKERGHGCATPLWAFLGTLPLPHFLIQGLPLSIPWDFRDCAERNGLKLIHAFVQRDKNTLLLQTIHYMQLLDAFTLGALATVTPRHRTARTQSLPAEAVSRQPGGLPAGLGNAFAQCFHGSSRERL